MFGKKKKVLDKGDSDAAGPASSAEDAGSDAAAEPRVVRSLDRMASELKPHTPESAVRVDEPVSPAVIPDRAVITPDDKVPASSLPGALTAEGASGSAYKASGSAKGIGIGSAPGEGFDRDAYLAAERAKAEEERRKEESARIAAETAEAEAAAAAAAEAAAAIPPHDASACMAGGLCTYTVFSGPVLNAVMPEPVSEPSVSVPGTGADGRMDRLDMKLDSADGNVLMLGGSVDSRSDMMNHMMSQIRSGMGTDDVAVVFDTRGTLYRSFGKDSDIVIGSDAGLVRTGESDHWNLFGEIDPDDIERSAREFSRSLFGVRGDSEEETSAAAASELFYAVLYIFCRYWKDQNGTDPTNHNLINFLKKANPAYILNVLNCDRSLASIAGRISDPESKYTKDVITKMNSVVSSLLTGDLGKDGSLSVTAAMNERGGRFIFIEHDPRAGDALVPVYSTLVDIALGQAIRSGVGSTYLFVDELGFISGAKHLKDSISCDDVHAIIGASSVTQLYGDYGEMGAKSIISAFSNCMFYRANDSETRQLIKGRFGRCMIKTADGTGRESIYEDDAVNDRAIMALDSGEAVIGMDGCPPFTFKAEKWEA